MSAINKPVFTHHRLEVYHLALRMAVLAKAVADSEPLHPARAAKRAEDRRTPRGYRSYADHLKRSSGNTVLLVGEGANRYSSGMKRQRYEEALGEAGEAAVVAEVVVTLGLVPEADTTELMRHADRVCAMLTRLVKRHST
jgi:four helix bundle protein